MKRFKFNLERFLDLRKFKEEECKMALGRAVSALNLIENEIRNTAVKRHNAASRRFLDINETIAWESYIVRLDKQTEDLTEKAAQAQIIVEEKRALYMEAQKNRKVIDELKEKKQKEHRKEMFNTEMNEIDDLTAARYNINI